MIEVSLEAVLSVGRWQVGLLEVVEVLTGVLMFLERVRTDGVRW